MDSSLNPTQRATEYWAADFGCAPEELFCKPLQLLTHSGGLADYEGVFALFQGGAVTVSFPPDRLDSLRKLLPPAPLSPSQFAAVFKDSAFRVIGPAYIGYAVAVAPPSDDSARTLSRSDDSAAKRLRAACKPTEWDHGGSEVGEDPCSGVYCDGKLVALAGYRVWPFGIAHIFVISHPEFRGQGYARSAVAHLARRALALDLTPQYRTLESNQSSLRVAESLGFVHYASSVAVDINDAV